MDLEEVEGLFNPVGGECVHGGSIVCWGCNIGGELLHCEGGDFLFDCDVGETIAYTGWCLLWGHQQCSDI